MEAQGQATPNQTQTQAQDPNAAKNPAAAGPAGQENQGQGQNAVKDAAKEAMRKLKIKYDDNREEELDESEAIRIVRERKQHQREANKKMQEGLAARKQAEQFIEMMKDKGNLFEAIKKLGHDPRKLSEEFLAEQLQYEMLDPKEKELREVKSKLAEKEAREKEAEERAKLEKEAKLNKALEEKFAKEFKEVIENSSLEVSKQTIGKMAGYIRRAAEIGYGITPAEAAKLVEQDEERLHAAAFANKPIETIIKYLGEDGVRKVREYQSSQLKRPEDNLNTPPPSDPMPRDRSGTTRMTRAQWRQYNRSR